MKDLKVKMSQSSKLKLQPNNVILWKNYNMSSLEKQILKCRVPWQILSAQQADVVNMQRSENILEFSDSVMFRKDTSSLVFLRFMIMTWVYFQTGGILNLVEDAKVKEEKFTTSTKTQ